MPPRRLRPPLDPAVGGLVRAARASQVSRRSLLGVAAVGGAAATLGACAPPQPPAAGTAELELPRDVSGSEPVVRWSNWTAYLDYDEDTKRYPTLEAFQRRTGIRATYSEDIEDNDSYFNKIAPQLRAGQDVGADIFVFTDWMANRVITDQLCQPLEIISMPNAPNLLDSLKDVSFDPGRTHSLTWQSGFAGIGYDRSALGREIRTLDDLWTEDLKGRIVVLSEFRDTVALVMQSQGVDITSDWGRAEFEKAVEVVEQKMSEGYIRRIKGNSYLEDLKSGNALAGIVWSGDLFVLRAETGNDDWTFTVPESGGTLWSDNMMVPITSTHRRNAMALMNYYYDPAVAAQVAAWVNYVCPVQGAQEELAKTDPELAESPFIFPSADYIARNNIQGFRALTPEEDQEYSALWQKVMGN
ncbi:spermidine/putrescine ABC transporter substrate-binding protein [Phycicoccus endophyticus]|uniref:Spermidine/putrescine ABC transporter substrate-binding protein n=1 Tax=Phycicoccus endophyticus TaxID=1690220 RepID=A0A7G9QY61_9MICO|nr:spermidine/putrescine ABC transporter substrate-binding protein [Phycicoccus endophyticus]NHI19170.1 spermidine/putrescine ABC transporter substrate-binding protein [Phycicoccus endophyticus]QNN48286.1 spermidine/putrescine ABC transporter substrate-binding protein [Phycicoccus endophyticus]GGL40715.1 polyamine-binding lipoprotein [Phycicoccus endophyticus]